MVSLRKLHLIQIWYESAAKGFATIRAKFILILFNDKPNGSSTFLIQNSLDLATLLASMH